jgi:serine/threonine-protein kinase
MIDSTMSHYRITEKIGEGGMGEVYRATDSKLQREVALKVLPPDLATDAERMGRFAREAHVLASLNHPNIATIHGLEQENGQQALVMELVEGETLGERIGRGPMDVAKALEIALQIAAALESAHEKGVIHRDLKPANVKITPDGMVKVLDFGLAKALEGERPDRDTADSPTLTAAATQAGIILGTAAYMSPEQAAGKPADRRSDIWSFGAVLAEMLTGKRQFDGESISHTLASVLKEEPVWEEFPAYLPPRILQLLKRCLRKEPKARLQSIGDARIVMEEYLADPEEFEAAGAPTTHSQAPPWRGLLPWAMAGLLAAALGLSLWPGGGRTPSPSRPPVHLNVELATDGQFFVGMGTAVVPSPDGRTIAYVIDHTDSRNLWVRDLSGFDGSVVPGSELAYNQFFSPDGQWIGFFTRTELKKVSITGGTPFTLAEVNLNRGGSWGDGDMIVYAPSPSSSLLRIPAAGGTPVELTTLTEGEVTHRWPHVLPGAEAVLFTSHTQGTGFDSGTIELVEVDGGLRRDLHVGGSYPRYAASGHIIFLRAASLFALPFDLETLEVTGEPFPMLEGVMSEPTHGSAQFGLTDAGTLYYLTGSEGLPVFSLVWASERDRLTPFTEDRRTWGEPRFSPDGKRLALEILTGTNWDAWVYDIDRGVATRLTFDEAGDHAPVWSPDGSQLVFSSDRDGNLNLYRKASNGSGDVERLTTSDRTQFVSSWSPDGRHILFTQTNTETASDLFVLDLEGGGEPEPYLVTPFEEQESAFSPDGKWVVYQSDESGRSEIYVRSFAAGGGKWQISEDGGTYPRWSRNGSEIFYRTGDGVIAVPVSAAGNSLRVDRPELRVQGAFARIAVSGFTYADYDVHPDGKRFVLFQADEGASNWTHARRVTNWLEGLGPGTR